MSPERPYDRRLAAALSTTVVTLAIAASGPVFAQQVSAHLTYARGPGADRCPEEPELRGAVATRLGYDPFQPEAAVNVVATITRTAHGLRARIEVRDATGNALGARDLESTRRDCAEIASASALAISIAIDPVAFAHPPPAAPSPAAPPPPPAPLLQPAPPPPAPPPRIIYVTVPAPPAPPPRPRRISRADRVAVRASLGALGSLGDVPSLALGFTASAGLRWRSFSIDLEGRADLPASATAPSGHGRVAASLLAGSLIPCLHLSVAAFCAIAMAGAIHGQGYDVTVPNEGSGPFVAAGARIGLEIPVLPFLALDVHADGLGTIVGTTLRLNDAGVWSAAVISGALGVAVRGEFR